MVLSKRDLEKNLSLEILLDAPVPRNGRHLIGL
jgi:hypothetical protein